MCTNRPRDSKSLGFIECISRFLTNITTGCGSECQDLTKSVVDVKSYSDSSAMKAKKGTESHSSGGHKPPMKCDPDQVRAFMHGKSPHAEKSDQKQKTSAACVSKKVSRVHQGKIGKITRNPFFNFLREIRQEQMKSNKPINILEIAKMGSRLWRNMSCQEKVKYFKMAETAPKIPRRHRKSKHRIRGRKGHKSMQELGRRRRSRSRKHHGRSLSPKSVRIAESGRKGHKKARHSSKSSKSSKGSRNSSPKRKKSHAFKKPSEESIRKALC